MKKHEESNGDNNIPMIGLKKLYINLCRWLKSDGWLESNIPFQHKYGYIRDEKSDNIQ